MQPFQMLGCQRDKTISALAHTLPDPNVSPFPLECGASADLHHCRGRATVSGDEKYLVTFNLVNGFDRYDLDSQERVFTYPRSNHGGIMLPVLFVHSSEDLVFGSSGSGVVQLLDIDAKISQNLAHSGSFKDRV